MESNRSWSRATSQSSTKPSFARSTCRMATAHTVRDANSFMEKMLSLHHQQEAPHKPRILQSRETSSVKKLRSQRRRRAQRNKDHRPETTVPVDRLITTASCATAWSPLLCSSSKRRLLPQPHPLAHLSSKLRISRKRPRNRSLTATSWFTTPTSACKSTKRSWLCTRRGSVESKRLSFQEPSRSLTWNKLRLKLESSSLNFNTWTPTRTKSQGWNASPISLTTILFSAPAAKTKRNLPETATTIATPLNMSSTFMMGLVTKRTKPVSLNKLLSTSNKIRVSYLHQSHKWQWLPPSKQPWLLCKAVTHSSRTFCWCITTHRFFQTGKWSQAITNKWSWFKMLSKLQLTDSSKLNSNQWCRPRCQHHRRSNQLRLQQRPRQCKIPKPSQRLPSQRSHWRPRKRNKKRERPPFWARISKLTNFKESPRMQLQRTSWSSQRKYLSQASHQRSEQLTSRGSNHLVWSEIWIIIFKKHQVIYEL